MHSIKHGAQQNLAESRLRQKQLHDSQSRTWIPTRLVLLSGCVALDLGNLGGRWVGPYPVISRNGINYSIYSKTWKDMVVYRNSVKKCVLPSGNGTSFSFVRESRDPAVIPGGPLPLGDVGPAQVAPPVFARPARLRQTVHPH